MMIICVERARERPVNEESLKSPSISKDISANYSLVIFHEISSARTSRRIEKINGSGVFS